MHIDVDEVIDEFMEDTPRAREWRAMREALEERLKSLKLEIQGAHDIDVVVALQRRVSQVREQIAALKQEEVVSQFVEDSLRVSLARPMAIRNDEDADE